MNHITILLAEDHQVVREGIRNLLKLERDFEVIGEAENGREAVSFASKLHPDVIVMDISMPLISGLEATRQIMIAAPNTRILVLSSHNDDAYIDQAKRNGGAGYLIKQTDIHRLPQAIRDVHNHAPFFCPSRPTV
jgi:DNA-binding NarL/FixJ family response regulator